MGNLQFSWFSLPAHACILSFLWEINLQVGTVTLLAVTGLLVFMLFFVAATANAIIVSFLISLAVAGGFLAFFFVCVTAIYIAALSLGVFVISTMTIATIIAVLITTGISVLILLYFILFYFLCVVNWKEENQRNCCNLKRLNSPPLHQP